MFRKNEDKVEFSIHVCDDCYNERKLHFEIFQLKRIRVRSWHPCAVCKTDTHWLFTGLADSESEVELMKEKITS